ncbi:hypothetical protein DX908_14955 [Parvularcula marina]|uniref:Uncharacterized protein n=2 Tax=Parvularcula marina TaxID=2292771 RepID=A0A371R840_9PROT|nr:hypothetical protein DX908_14955 [Parvularcula marina]
MTIVMVVYVASVVGINLIDSENMSASARIALSLIPVLPAIAMVFVIIRYVRRIDEVQQRIITEACLVSLIIVGLACFTYGFVEGAVSLPEISLIWVFPSLIGTAGISLPFVRLRYV